MRRILVAATAVSCWLSRARLRRRKRHGRGRPDRSVVKVVNMDRKARTVTFQGPRGRLVTLKVPKEAQNFDQVKIGSTFKVKYVEAVAVALSRGGKASLRLTDRAPGSEGGTPAASW